MMRLTAVTVERRQRRQTAGNRALIEHVLTHRVAELRHVVMETQMTKMLKCRQSADDRTETVTNIQHTSHHITLDYIFIYTIKRGKVSVSSSVRSHVKGKGKGKEEYLYSVILVRTHTLKALRHGSHSFTCKQHHACLSFVSFHQMAPPQLRQQTSSCS